MRERDRETERERGRKTDKQLQKALTYVPLFERENRSAHSLPEAASLLATMVRIPSKTVLGLIYLLRDELE